MTNREILIGIVKKVVKHGWDDSEFRIYRVNNSDYENPTMLPIEESIDVLLINNEYFRLIFDKDFAKAFWGEDTITGLPEWKYHLQQMILEDNPLKYLEKYL